jgi:hypothetical protein
MKTEIVRGIGQHYTRREYPNYYTLKFRNGERVYCTREYFNMYCQLSGTMHAGWIVLTLVMNELHPLYEIALSIAKNLNRAQEVSPNERTRESI